MATAAPHVKLLRQLASAKDDYLSGAFDISWDGAKATLYLVFGRPSHAVFDSDQAQIEGEAAIDALLAELPRTFAVSDWRRAMSPQETLSISIDELAGPFVRLAGSYADDPVGEESPEWWSADDSSPDLAFGLSDFPLLPGGRPLWAETSPENVNLAERLAELPPSILILTGAKLRAAAVVSGGDLIDAVWIDDEDQARGEAAGMALLGATKGSLAGYALDDPRVAEALTMLWRLPLAVSGIEMSWLDPASMLAAFRADGLDRVLVIDAPVRGIALFSRGGLVAVYSETQRSAVASPERLRSLLSQARGRLTVMERKPRPVAAPAAHTAPSATDFFGVLATEAPAEATPEAAEQGEEESHVADGEPADAAAAVETEAATETDAAAESGAHVETEAAAESGMAAETEAHPESTVGVGSDAAAVADAAAETSAETEGAAEIATAEPDRSTGYPPPDSEADASAIVESDTPEATVDHAPEAASTEEPTAEPAAEGEPAATFAEHGADGSELPPPPPPDAEQVAPPTDSDVAASAEHAPPPPAPDTQAEPGSKTKRHWWSRGGSRKKDNAASTPTPETIAAETAAAHEAADAASFAGWSVRQQNPEPQPVWQRSRDYVEGSDGVAEGAEAPPPAPEAAVDAPAADAEAAAAAPSWSVIDPGTAAHRAPSEQSAPLYDPAGEAEAPAVQPETAASQGWSARDVLADSVGWYQPAEPVHPEGGHESPADEAPADAADDVHEGSTAEAPGDAAEGAPEATGQAAHEGDGDAAHEGAAEATREGEDDTAPDVAAEAMHATDSGPAPDVAPGGHDEHDVAASHAAIDWYHPAPLAATDHQPAGEDEHESVAAAESTPSTAHEYEAAAGDHDLAASDEKAPTGETDAEPVAAAGDEPADATEHDPSAHVEPAHDFWAEFASPDPDADADTSAESAEAEPAASEAETAEAPVEGDHQDLFIRKSSERTVAPWSWPLAESEPTAAPTPHSSTAAPVEETPEPATTSAQAASESEDWEPVFEGAGDQSFFQRDEPVGSQFVDFDEVRTELVQIGVVWLGEANAVPVTALLRKTRSTIDDFVATIDTIRGLHLEGQDPASIQAMAREMHQQAAERLCGA
jgi:hypothetical protein